MYDWSESNRMACGARLPPRPGCGSAPRAGPNGGVPPADPTSLCRPPAAHTKPGGNALVVGCLAGLRAFAGAIAWLTPARDMTGDGQLSLPIRGQRPPAASPSAWWLCGGDLRAAGRPTADHGHRGQWPARSGQGPAHSGRRSGHGAQPPGHNGQRSSDRYWMASATWAEAITSVPSRSAMVRATLRIRS